MSILKIICTYVKTKRKGSHKSHSFGKLTSIHTSLPLSLFFSFVSEQLQRSKPGLVTDQILSELEEKDHQITSTDYVISGEIIGELNCLTNQPMKYSATCKTVVEVRKHHLMSCYCILLNIQDQI